MRKKIHALLIPTITFVIGILVQSLFDSIINSSNLSMLSTVVIMISLFVIFVHLSQIDNKIGNVNHQLLDITNRAGVHAEYIEDGAEGKSYVEATELVEKARKSLMFIEHWEPFPEYQVNHTSVMKGDSQTLEARKKFYQAVIKQIDAHRFDESPYHRRIVQVPREYIDKRLPLETDPVFFEYMLHAAQMQESKPHSCVIRKSSVFFNTYFTLIDNRYIIIPILTRMQNIFQTRHGALIIEDIDGQLVARLNSIYWAIESRSTPLKIAELELETDKPTFPL